MAVLRFFIFVCVCSVPCAVKNSRKATHALWGALSPGGIALIIDTPLWRFGENRKQITIYCFLTLSKQSIMWTITICLLYMIVEIWERLIEGLCFWIQCKASHIYVNVYIHNIHTNALPIKNNPSAARLRGVHDGLFTGQIDAVDTGAATYRVTFDRKGLGTHTVPDYEVLVSLFTICWCWTSFSCQV